MLMQKDLSPIINVVITVIHARRNYKEPLEIHAICIAHLRFFFYYYFWLGVYSPVNTVKDMSSWSVNLLTLFPGQA